MAVVARLEAILSANTRDFDHAMTKSETKMQKTGRVAGIAGAAIAGGLAIGLEKSVHAAIDAQKTQARLEVAFKTAHLSAGAYEKQIGTLEGKSRKLGFTDEQVKNSLGSLIVATHSMKKASQDLSVAQDIARFKNISLEAATKMLTMAQAGSQRATKQLGLSVQAATTNQDKAKEAWHKSRDALKLQEQAIKNETAAQKAHFQALKDTIDQQYQATKSTAVLMDHQVTSGKVIELVSQKLHGQADAYSKTAAGSMEQFKAQLTNLEVSLGTALLPALAQVATALAKGAAFFAKHATAAKVLVGVLGALATALLAASVAQRIMNLAVLANPYVAAIAAVIAAGIAIYVFRDKLVNVFNWIKDHWPLLAGILSGGIGIAVAEIVKHRDRLIEIFTNLPGQIAHVFTAGIGAIKDAIVGLFGKVIGWVKDALGIGSPSKVFYEIGQHSIQGFINGVGSMAGLLKKAVTGIVGDVAGKLGGVVGGVASGTFGGGGGPNNPYRAAAKQIAAQYGWTGAQWRAYDAVEMREAGYNPEARGPNVPGKGSAGGIPQALPVTKLPLAARPKWAGGGGDAVLQIRWMMNYIKGRYGDPLGAWAHEQRFGWYDKGGWLPPGLSLALNTTGRPERVVTGGGGDTVIVNVGPEEVARVVFDQMRGKARVFMRNNSRPAFGGA